MSPSVKHDTGPHQSAASHVVGAYVKCFEDFVRCGAPMVSDRSSVLLDGVFSSPFGRVPKKDVFGAINREGRFVHDCSYPKGRGGGGQHATFGKGRYANPEGRNKPERGHEAARVTDDEGGRLSGAVKNASILEMALLKV